MGVNRNIDQLPDADALTGDEWAELLQAGINKRVTAQQIADLAAASGDDGNPYRIDRFGATTSAIDNTTDVQDCFDACAADGGGYVSFPIVTPGDEFNIDGEVTIPPGVGLAGLDPLMSVFAITDPAAKVQWGEPGTASAPAYGRASGNFAINGTNVALNPMVVNQAVKRLFYNFFARYADPDPTSGSAALLTYGTQNSDFLAGQIFGGAQALQVDGGSANNHFDACEIGGGTLYDLAFRAALTSPTGQLPYTFSNLVTRAVMEWTEATTKAMVIQTGGSANALQYCDIRSNAHFGGSPSGSLPTTMDAMIVADLTEYASFSTLLCHDLFLAGYNAPLSAAYWAKGTAEINVEGGVVGAVPSLFRGNIRCNRPPQKLGTVTTGYVDKPFAERRALFTDITQSAADIIHGTFVDGGAHLTHYVDAAGTARYGDGTNNVDAGWGRIAANQVGPISGSFLGMVGTWNTPHILMAGYHIWVNAATGKLYIRVGAPGSATDGTLIGPP